MLENLFIVRHGEHDSEGNLSEYGKEQIRESSVSIYDNLNIWEKDPLILTSSAPRARESASVIADIFNTSYQYHDRLWSGMDSACRNEKPFGDFPKILNLIKEERKIYDNLILVTHNEIVTALPFLFSDQEFDKVKYFRASIRKGEGMHLSVKNKIWYHIPTGRITNDLNYSNK